MNPIASFIFSPFAENTYVLSDPSGDCVIVDPGCTDEAERNALSDYIESNKLNPVRLLNTHCHIDHVLGNAYAARRWKLTLEAHQGEQVVLNAAGPFAGAYGIPYEDSPAIGRYLEHGDVVEFGQTKLEVLFTPGHSPASVSFYNRRDGYVLCGDTLFAGSVGRTDLPGGDTQTLMESITRELLSLPPETRLLAGHMEETTVAREERTNPFVQAWKKGLPLS